LRKLGVVAALAAEARAFDRSIGRTGAPEPAPALIVSGIGRTAAAATAHSLVTVPVGALMTFGVAGGLDPALKAGVVVLPSHVISREGVRLPTCASWRARLADALRSSHTVVGGTLLSSTQAIATTADKAVAFRDAGAVAVDMESVAVAEIAAAARLPFIAVRVIVDTAADALPRAVIAASGAGQVRILKLLSGLLSTPGEIAALLKLSLRYPAAMRSLRGVAAAGAVAWAPLDSDTYLS
jgi:adenosylhomocysteine nucleosidase